MARGKIRVLHLINSLNCGGAEMMLYKILSRMNAEHFDSTVVCMIGNGPLEERVLALGIPVLNLNMRRGVPNPLGFFRLLRIIRTLRPSILQTWMYHSGLLGLLAGRLGGVRAILWNMRCSRMDFAHYSFLSRITVRAASIFSAYPEIVLFNSVRGDNEHQRQGFRPRTKRVIPNGFDLSSFRPEPNAKSHIRNALGIPQDAVVIGLVARYHPMKDHKTFLEAAAKVKHEFPRSWFLLVGEDVDPSNEDIMRQLRQLNLTERVSLLGLRNDVPRLLQALDVLALSSAFGEGFPNVLGEAMACGLPCVVTDVGDAALIVGDTGIVVPPKRSDALAGGVKSILRLTREQREALGRNARERVETFYSIEGVTRQYEKLYRAIEGIGDSVTDRDSQAATYLS